MRFPIELGFDSFVACTAIGLVTPQWGRRIALIVLFGGFDALATFVANLGWGSAGLAVFVVALSVALVAVPSLRVARVVALPLLLCIDNLMDPLRSIDAVPRGIVSAALAAAGFVASSLVMASSIRFAAPGGNTTAAPAARVH